MNIENKLLKQSSLEKLILKLKEEGKQVFAPVKKNDIVDFSEIASLQEMTEDYIVTVQSAKAVAFPKVETLFDFQISKSNVAITEKDTQSLPEVVLLGARPCDAAAFEALNAIFTWDNLNDHFFVQKLKKTTIIGFSCSKADDKCFCTSVNGNPGSTRGSDILLTKIDNGNYLAEIITEKGQDLAAKYADLFEAAPEVDKNKYLADVPVQFELKAILDNISGAFDHPLWVKQSLRCISCGACAYVCPTCACFDIQDINNGSEGHRKRSWDSCGFGLFTIHTSGHNPREVQSQRWRQRVMHKFAYMPERQQVVGCVGCGRCSRSCPADMNLKEHLINLAKEVAK